MASTELIVSNADLVTQLQPFIAKAGDLLAQANRAVIDTQENADRGSDFLKITKSAKKQLDEARREVVDPYNKRIKVINAEVKKVTVILDHAIEVASKKVLAFEQEKKRLAREERERIDREAAERALEAAEKAEAEGKPEVADQILELAAEAENEAPRPMPARGELTGASTSVRMTWTARVDNIRHMCKAIAEGHLPESLIKEVSQSELNRLAREYGASATDGAYEVAQYGIVYFQKAGLTTR